MKLRDFRKLKGLTIRQASAEIGVSHVAWGYWEKGQRIPEEANMDAIFQWSGGAVAPNDFYLLSHTGS